MNINDLFLLKIKILSYIANFQYMNEMGCINKIIIHHTERNNDSPSFVTLRHKYLRRWEDI
ncbi:TPA: hypothetical protein DEG21_02170 [Patescibacteria group bacterium]|nr:hypothetical protein [Candidatus Gracilibacteria bacterium]